MLDVRAGRPSRYRIVLVGVAAVALVLALLPGRSEAIAVDRFIVSFDAPPTDEDLEVLAGVATAVHAFDHLPAAVVTLTPDLTGLLRALPGVVRVDRDESFERHLAQSTATIRADAAWDAGWTGAGVGIAVIDTGIDGTHPDLCAAPEFCDGTPVKTVQNVKILGRQTVLTEPVVVLEDQLNSDTSSGHGSHVAGIAAGLGVAGAHEADRYRGVAPGASLIGLSTGEAIEAVNVLAAFDWVIEHADEHDIKVVNNSWGPGRGAPFDPAHPVQRAIDAAHAAGISVVFGAGNDGPSTDTLNAFSANPNAISVAGGTKDGHIAFFSSRGVPGSELWQPTVTAPGYNIAAARSSTGFYGGIADLAAPNPDPIEPPDTLRYASASGTSMAAPHVAGVIALVQEAARTTRGGYLSPDEVTAVLQRTAVRDDDARGPGGLPRYQPYTMGAGYVDALAATAAVVAGASTAPFEAAVSVDVQGFAGRVGPAALVPTETFEVVHDVLPGARTLDVAVDWPLVADDVDLELYAPSGALVGSTFLRCDPAGEPNGYSSFCSSQPNERITVVEPAEGRWRAVVRGGLLSTVVDVTGLWSTVYPAGTDLPAPAAPATVTVAPVSSVGLAGAELDVAVTVRDADGAPVLGAELGWASTGVGEVAAGERHTRADGTAAGRVRSTAPGQQRLTVTAGGAAASVDVTWLGLDVAGLLDLSGSTPGRASGGGWVEVDGRRRTFAIHAEVAPGGGRPGGELVYRDPAGPSVTGVPDRLVVDGDRATITGPAEVDGTAGYRFRLEVRDLGEPGRGVDHLDLEVTSPLSLTYPYRVRGILGGGNLQVRS